MEMGLKVYYCIMSLSVIGIFVQILGLQSDPEDLKRRDFFAIYYAIFFVLGLAGFLYFLSFLKV